MGVPPPGLILCCVVDCNHGIPSYYQIFNGVFFICGAIVQSSIFLLHILVYKEARRQEKQILSQQVSMEARAKFNQEMRARKLTSIILMTPVFICCLSPLIFVFVIWLLFSEAFSPHAKTLVRHLALLPVLITSFLNPASTSW